MEYRHLLNALVGLCHHGSVTLALRAHRPATKIGHRHRIRFVRDGVQQRPVFGLITHPISHLLNGKRIRPTG